MPSKEMGDGEQRGNNTRARPFKMCPQTVIKYHSPNATMVPLLFHPLFLHKVVSEGIMS